MWLLGLLFVLIRMMMTTRVEETHYHCVALSNIITEQPFRTERFLVTAWLDLKYFMIITDGLKQFWTTVGYGRLWLIRQETEYSCKCSSLLYDISVTDDTCISLLTHPAPGTSRGKGYYVDVYATDGFRDLYRLRKGNLVGYGFAATGVRVPVV